MNRLLPNPKAFAALLAIAAVVSGAAGAADLSEPVILVASSRLDPTPFQQAVVLAAPLDDGSHIAFIINKPTGMKLQELFPDDPAAGNVKESVYLGGPAFVPYSLRGDAPATRKCGRRRTAHARLFAVMDGDAIDRLIATTPDDARFFLGMMVWRPGALEQEVGQQRLGASSGRCRRRASRQGPGIVEITARPGVVHLIEPGLPRPTTPGSGALPACSRPD